MSRSVHASPAPAYAEFAVTSNFSFLHGASHPEELIGTAIAQGLSGLGLADRNSVAGVVRAHLALREVRREHPDIPLRYHPGARLVPADGTPDILAYPMHRAGWGRLCRLLTLGNRRVEKGRCHLLREDVLAHAEGLSLIVLPDASRPPPPPDLLGALKEAARGNVRLGARAGFAAGGRHRLAVLAEAAQAARMPLIAVNDVLYHTPRRRPLQDTLTCIRHGVTIEEAGRRLEAHAERHLKPAAEMARLFRTHPGAVAETLAMSGTLGFSLDVLRYEYPDEVVDGFATAQAALIHFTYAGAKQRYPAGVPDKVRLSIAHEIALIGELGYAPYFLTVFDIVRFARGQGILCQGRGSAANSAVCFCLGITEVDPDKSDLLFERFVSADRREPPDIDVDFEHQRREEVIQYIYQRYGRERAGLAATVISYRARSAIRETGKAMGLPGDALDALSSGIWGYGAEGLDKVDARRAGVDRDAPRVRQAFALAEEIAGFPRHLSQHVGGFVITRGRLDELVPVANAAMEDRTVIEWDKDDIDALGILKVDVLGLGMLTCLKHAFALLDQHYGRKLTLATLPAEDEAVYRMLCRADSLGVFQVESRAQMSMLPRLRPKTFYDLVIEVAIVRPGPIQGDMVHPYLRRRQGQEPVVFPSRELEAVLGKTLGVPLFQEQAMKIAIVAAGFTPSEADRLRRAMATFRKVGTIGTFQDKMIEGMAANGYDRAFAERCFKQIEGFGEYGFPESHAASFALLVYASSWFKCHYPDVFAAALLNAQPLGFYAPAQIVRDAREHGVEVHPVDVNHSHWDATLEASGGEASSRSPVETGARDAGPLPIAPRGAPAPFQRPHHLDETPPPCGEGQGWGAARSDAAGGLLTTTADHPRSHPTPTPSPSRGGEPMPRSAAVASEYPTPAPPHRGEGGLFPREPARVGDGQLPIAPRGAPAPFQRPHHPDETPPPCGEGQGWGAARGEPFSGSQAPPGLHPRHAEMASDILTACAVRLGMREIKGLKEEAGRRVAERRGRGYDSVRDVWLRTGLDVASLELLADADAFGSIGLSRRDALWAVRALGRTGDDDDLPLFSAPSSGPRREPDAHLPPMPLGEEVINDYRFLRMSLKAHPMSFVRQRLDWRRVTPSARLGEVANGARVAVAGLVLVRQRPGTAKGVIFATLEDEGGIANVIVWPKVFERFRPVVLGARALLVTGTLQKESGVIHVVARHIEDATPMLGALSEDISGVDPVMPADEVKRPEPGSRRGKSEGDEMRRDRIAAQLPLLAELDVPARATRHALPKGRNFR